MSYAWPRWPPDDERTRQTLGLAVLTGRRSAPGTYSGLPQFLDAAAARVAELVGRRYAVLTSSGSSAIWLALRALGIGQRSRVLVPATASVGCATAVHRVGAAPVFLDAGADTPCASAAFEKAAAGRVDAVLAVHSFASQADIRALRTSLPGVPIVEDCSHCPGAASPAGQPLGSLGDLSVLSFGASKLLPAGAGGAVVTDDENMTGQLLALTTRSFLPVEPADVVRGSSCAMSELSAATLWAQLLSLPSRASVRADGLRFLASQLDQDGGSLVFDEASRTSGAFYGVLFQPATQWLEGADRVIDQISARCGARLDRVYPPIPLSPLYREATNPSDQVPIMPVGATQVRACFPNSIRWHQNAVVLPHSLFLADVAALTELAETINQVAMRQGRRPVIQPRRGAVARREVCVAMVTSGRRDTLTEALSSVGRQTYTGPCSVLLLCDNQDDSAERVPGLVAAANLPASVPVRMLTLTLGQGTGDETPLARVARLRQVALGWVTAPLVAFLDDDNAWEPCHLTSLADLLEETNSLAVHSWRTLLDPYGEPHAPETFPWLTDPSAAATRYALLRNAGMFGEGSPVVRDQASVQVGGRDYGVVDMGEWLFDRRLFDILRFDTSWTAEQVAGTIGEDDKLLARLHELLIPIHCTEQATLRYRLGGFTNNFAAKRSPGCPGSSAGRSLREDEECLSI